MRRVISLSVLAGLLVLAAPAFAKTIDVVDALGGRLTSVAKKTSVPVRVPASVDIGYDGRTYASGSAKRGSYTLGLGGAPRCNGSNACFLADFSGERGGTPAFRTRVRLRGGRTGWYKPLTCGASCSDPVIQWKQGGVLYSLSVRMAVEGDAAQRAAMVAAANSAIAAPAR